MKTLSVLALSAMLFMGASLSAWWGYGGGYYAPASGYGYYNGYYGGCSTCGGNYGGYYNGCSTCGGGYYYGW